MHQAESSIKNTQEVSPICASTGELWSTTRSIPDPPSPRTPSAISESLSDLSNIELTSSDPSNSTTDSLHSDSNPAISDHIHNHISDPAAHLSIPNIPISHIFPKTKISSTMSQLSNLAKMPRRHSKHAPPLFKGDYSRVTRFIELYDQLLEYHQVNTDKDKCKGILEYCSQSVEDFITSCPTYIRPNWDRLKEDILKYYDAERMDTRIQLGDFVLFLQKQVRTPITTLSQWKKYNRKYLAYAGFLMRNEQLNETEYEGYFWYGIPEDLRSILEVRLQARNPTFDNSIDPWPVSVVQEVAEAYLKRNKFSDKLFHLPALGMGRRYEDEDEEDDDYDEDDDDDDEYEEDRRRRKKKNSSKKKSKKFIPSLHLPPIQTLKEEPSRKILPPLEDTGLEKVIQQLNTMTLEDPRYRALYNRVTENKPTGVVGQYLKSLKIAPPLQEEQNVGNMIQRLNTMALEDPEYGSLYWKTVTTDQTGLAVQCITRKPKLESRNRPTRDPLPHQSPPMNLPIRPPYPRGILPQMPEQTASQNTFKCYGCADPGHSIRDCPAISNLLLNKVIYLDSQFKYRFPDGQLIPRRFDESFVQVIERLRPTQNKVQFATVGEAVEQYYHVATGQRNHYCEEESSDEEEYYEEERDMNEDEEDNDQDEEDEYEESHWSWKARRRQECPNYVSYEAIDEDEDEPAYNAYPVERGSFDKTTRQARTAAMNEPIRKTRFDGVVLPPRQSRVPARVPELVTAPRPAHPLPAKPQEPFKPRQNVPPRQPAKQPVIPPAPIPVDARRPRFKETADVIMKELESMPQADKENRPEKKAITVQDYPNTVEEKKADSNLERARPAPRQSDLTARVDSKSVVEKLLKTPVSLSLEDVLGTSRELTNNLQDIMKLKNPKPLPTPLPTGNTVQKVLNASLRKEAAEMEENYSPDFGREDTPQEKDLIKLVLTCHGRPVTAVIDTGSQLNIVSPEIVKEKILLPVDLSKPTTMNVANGNTEALGGLIVGVPLRCGAVITDANLYVGPENLPFDMLLGRPWQIRNRVSIDERKTGTWLIFKDPETDQPKFEIYINPSQFISRNFKPYRNIPRPANSGYLVTESAETEPLAPELEMESLESIQPPEEEKEQVCNLKLTCNGIPIAARFDTGSLINVVSAETARKLKLPIRPIKDIPKAKRKGHPYNLRGFIKNAFIQYGNAKIYIGVDLFIAKDLPYEMVLGSETTRFLSTAEHEFPPRIGMERAINVGALKIEDEEEQEVVQELVEGLKRSKLQNEAEDREDEIEPSSQVVFGILVDEKLENEKLKERQYRESPQIPEREEGHRDNKLEIEGRLSLAAQGQCSPQETSKELVEQTGEIVKQEKNKDKDMKECLEDLTTDLERSEVPLECVKECCQVKRMADEQEKCTIPVECSLPEKEDEDKDLPESCQCRKHNLKRCRHRGDNSSCLSCCQKNQKFEPRSPKVERIRSRDHIDKPPDQNSPKAHKSMVENYIYTTRGLQTNPCVDSPAMSKPSGPYEPPTDSPIHPILNLPLDEVRSTVARIHDQAVFNRTNFCFQPPAPLKLKADHVFLATNRKVPEVTVAPFCWAELVSSNVELVYSI